MKRSGMTNTLRRLVLRRLSAVEIGEDGTCKCDCASPCPLGRIASEPRCTVMELLRRGHVVFMSQNISREPRGSAQGAA